MDIFEEIKEAVISATPGEDTRNYYRNQGMKIERDRIIKLLEIIRKRCDEAYEESSLDGLDLALDVVKNSDSWADYLGIALIKGED